MIPVLCIAGPTASGKSAWAISLAKLVGGEIINADAMQVYSDLQILSARPDDDEMQEVPHHMFGHIDGQVRYSTGHWLREVQNIILEVLARQKVPILVGGTGLYFKALTEGLAEIPTPDEKASVQAERILNDDGIEALRDKAQALDPLATERVMGADPQRLLRIVAVALGTSAPLSHWQARTKPVIPKCYWMGVKRLPERQGLYERINRRFETMVDRGGLDEVRALYGRNLSSSLPVMKAIGVRQLLPVLSDKSALSEALDLAKRDTRRFAKRQFTWLRGNMGDWHAVSNIDEKRAFEALFIARLESARSL